MANLMTPDGSQMRRQSPNVEVSGGLLETILQLLSGTPTDHWQHNRGQPPGKERALESAQSSGSLGQILGVSSAGGPRETPTTALKGPIEGPSITEPGPPVKTPSFEDFKAGQPLYFEDGKPIAIPEPAVEDWRRGRMTSVPKSQAGQPAIAEPSLIDMIRQMFAPPVDRGVIRSE